MAITARSVSESGAVGIVLCVAFPTLAFRRSKLTVWVALRTGHFLMPPLEGKLAHRVMIKAQMSAFEAALSVTFATGHLAELPLVGRLVTADAIPRLGAPSLPLVTV